MVCFCEKIFYVNFNAVKSVLSCGFKWFLIFGDWKIIILLLWPYTFRLVQCRRWILGCSRRFIRYRRWFVCGWKFFARKILSICFHHFPGVCHRFFWPRCSIELGRFSTKFSDCINWTWHQYPVFAHQNCLVGLQAYAIQIWLLPNQDFYQKWLACWLLVRL